MPERLREQVVATIVAKVSAGVPKEAPGGGEAESCAGEDCLRWPECNGTDPQCPYKAEGRLMPWPREKSCG